MVQARGARPVGGVAASLLYRIGAPFHAFDSIPEGYRWGQQLDHGCHDGSRCTGIGDGGIRNWARPFLLVHDTFVWFPRARSDHVCLGRWCHSSVGRCVLDQQWAVAKNGTESNQTSLLPGSHRLHDFRLGHVVS